MGLLEYYEDKKSHIPSNSRWFNRTPVHKDWFLTDSSTLLLAMQTHSYIEPEMVPNAYWFEDRIWDLITNAIDKLLADGNPEIVCDYLNSLYNYYEKSGYDLEIKKCEEIVNKINPILMKYLIGVCSENNYTDEQLGILEIWSVVRMSAPLGFYKFGREMTTKAIISHIDNINWDDKADLYNQKIPAAVLPRLEFIQERLRIERAVEGKTISPNWYIRQLIASRYFDLTKEAR